MYFFVFTLQISDTNKQKLKLIVYTLCCNNERNCSGKPGYAFFKKNLIETEIILLNQTAIFFLRSSTKRGENKWCQKLPFLNYFE